MLQKVNIFSISEEETVYLHQPKTACQILPPVHLTFPVSVFCLLSCDDKTAQKKVRAHESRQAEAVVELLLCKLDAQRFSVSVVKYNE